MRIVYMGTPDFAVPPLAALLDQGFDVAAVVTQPDRPKGRGRKLAPPPVKSEALARGLPVLQPEFPKDPGFAAQLAAFEADVFVVIAFGCILPQSLLDLPRIMPINIHASLLPKLRGPAPIQWAIINGDDVTGVTAMRMEAGMDTGGVLASAETPIRPDDDSQTLHDRLSLMGADLLGGVLGRLDDITPRPQDHGQATYARALEKKDGRIDWRAPAVSIERLIRGVTPWPGAFTFYDEGKKRLKILKASLDSSSTQAAPGTVLASRGGPFLAAAGDGVLNIERVQGASGKPMDAAGFLRGARIEPGAGLG